MSDKGEASEIRAVRLSKAAPAERRALLEAYTREVYLPAFPDAEIREDTGNWLALMESEPWPAPPQPLLEVILMIEGERILGGVTIELYRAATVGFLTYIAVAEAARGKGVGQRLVAAARAWLDETGGADVPMLAETERFEDAHNEKERAATVVRQRQLAGLGARMIDFDYIMPPLRAGLSPHRLHMMMFGGPDTLSGARVLGLLEELAAALDTALDRFEDTKAMAAALAADPLLKVKPLPKGPPRPRPDRELREAPIFIDLDATSFTFAFELEYSDKKEPDPAIEESGEDQEIDGRHRAALRLRALSTALAGLKAETEDKRHIYRRLIQPVRSFLDDVTMGPAGSNGRPLLFGASGALPNADSRRMWIVRPRSWDYEYENEVTRLTVPEDQRCVEFRLRDSFCAFESGRIFYLLTLTQETGPDEEVEDEAEEEAEEEAEAQSPRALNTAERIEAERDPEIEDQAPPKIDEYLVLQLQQLVLDKKVDAKRADVLGFWSGAEPPMEGQERSLLAFAQERLDQLHDNDLPSPNGVHDIIKRYELAPPKLGDKPMRLGLRHLHRLCIGIECDDMLGTAVRVRQRFEPGDSAAQATAGTALPVPLWEEWKDRHRKKRPRGDPRAHDQAGNAFDRTFLAFAGVAQAVPDFPWQDESEIHDSTRPAAHSVESSLYVHPRFVLEVAKSWRSFEQARPTIGTCPYLLLMFMVALHDELIVSEMEEQIDDMVYADDGDAGQDGPYRVVPMYGVHKALANAHQAQERDIKTIRDNLEYRFDLFRWASIQRSGNLFRYPKERGALTAIQAAMGTGARYDRAHDIVDRMESLVEDVTSLRTSYAEKRTAKAEKDAADAQGRTQKILAAIGVLSIFSVAADLGAQFRSDAQPRLYVMTLVIVIVAIGGYALLVLFFRKVFALFRRRKAKAQDKRRSKSS